MTFELATVALSMGLAIAGQPDSAEDLFGEMLSSTSTLRGLAAEPERYRLQIIVGEIDEEASAVEWHMYRPDAEYFYPASTVKLPIAAVALTELRRLSDEHDSAITRNTPLVFHPLFDGETTESADETNVEQGTITVGHEIRKIMLVSDNAAFNRLYEFVGHARGNSVLHDDAGLSSLMLTHRLSEYRTPEQNRRSPAISVRSSPEHVELPARTSDYEYDPDLAEQSSIPLGRAYQTGSRIVHEPMEFADNNRISLMDLTRVVQLLVRPDLSKEPNLGLHDDDRAFLVQAMGELPAESANPVYNSADYPDEWGKFFLPGVRRVFPGNRIRVHNKIGRAYGTSTDAAYLRDTETGRAVFLAVTMYTNDNAVLNDNVYEYESLADPAMADIGEFIANRFLAIREPLP